MSAATITPAMRSASAFPVHCVLYECESGHDDGMTLRDYFAAAFLTGLAANQAGLIAAGGDGTSPHQETAELAYYYADAMLLAREQK